MKKATSKRERKYGKKNEEGQQVKKPIKDKVVKVMVDYAMILKFKNKQEAEAYINKSHREAEKNNQEKASYIFI